ncbi:SOB FIVE-LIKE 5-like protein [Drosera capensis]
MDYSGSECSSGCESGWTSYFDESTHSPNQLQKGKSKKSAHENHKVGGRNSICYHNGGKHDEDEEEEEEDLSMVSDASSGPPTHSKDFYYYQDCGSSEILPMKSDSKKTKKKKQNGGDQQRGKQQQQQQQQHSYLDDTATSPAFDHHFSHKFSSADQFQGNFVFSNQFGTFWQSSHPKHPDDSAEPSQMRGKIWK